MVSKMDKKLYARTLYVSDLDGTLLRSNERTSQYTNETINRLSQQGMLFSYATARSFVTSKKVTQGIHANIPLIVYNGAFVMNNTTEEIMISNFFDTSVNTVFSELFKHNIYPIVYSYNHGKEQFSFIESKCTRGMRLFLNSRKGDLRSNPVSTASELVNGNCFYITCIDEPELLEPFYLKYKDIFHCVYEQDLYTKEQWLEIMPKAASKSNAILQLKDWLKCDRLVVFGDGKNDIDMFSIADECYAVENAVSELKEKATAIIGGNDSDSVAKWLECNYGGTTRAK